MLAAWEEILLCGYYVLLCCEQLSPHTVPVLRDVEVRERREGETGERGVFLLPLR